MKDRAISRPEASEYSPYYERYVSLVHDDDILEALAGQLVSTLEIVRGIDESEGGRRYATGKWSIKELVGHIADTERIFAYRALRFARQDPTPLPGFEQDGYIRHAGFDAYSLSELREEFEHVRRANLSMFRHFDDAAWLGRGIASDAVVTVRALAYIIAGHEKHHMEILKTRYL